MARADVAGPARANLRWSQWLGPNPADITQFDSVVSSPAVAADGTIYIGVQGTGLVPSGLLAFAPDGTEKWHYDTGLNAVESGAVVRADGSVVFASVDGTLVALEPTGQLRWSTSLGARASASPLVGPDGTVYEGTDNGIVAVHPDGTIAWTSPGCDVGTGGASLQPDGSISFNCQGAVMVLLPSGAPGSPNLSATDGMQVIYGPPTIGPGGEVWFAANSATPNQSPSATLYSYSSAAGFQKREFGWEGAAFFNSPALLPGGDAVTGVPYPDPPNNRGAFGAAQLAGGFTQWQAYPQGIEVQPSVDVDGNVYFIDGTTVVSLGPTGTPRWTSAVDSSVEYGLAIGSDGTIYVGTVNGYLYAFGP
jgi:outer membrane protein assembly factor BamB